MSGPGVGEPAPAGPGEGRRLARASAVVAGFGVIWKGLGLVREAAVGAIFGANRAMDGFVVAKSIPDMFSTWVETPLRAAVIPIFSKTRHEKGEDAAWAEASNVLNTLALGLALLAGALWLGAPLLVRMLSSGFRDAAQWDASARMTQILAGSVFFSVLAVVLGSLSNIYGRQAVPALGRNLNAVVVLLGVVLLGPRMGLDGYAWGMLFGAAAYFLIQLDILWIHRRRYRFVVRPFAPEMKQVAAIGVPLFIGLTGTRIDVILDRNFASFLADGSLSILIYATMLSALVTDLVLTVTTSVLLPHFSKLMAEGRHDELRARLTQSLTGYAFLMAPVTVSLLAGAKPLVEIVYGRGQYTPEAVALTAFVLMILAPADPVFGAGQMIAQAHISGGDTKTPMYIGFWRIGFKALVSVALLPVIGIFGLAAATAASSFLRTFLLWKRLPETIRPRAADLGAQLGGIVLPAAAAAIVLVAGFFFVPPVPERVPGVAVTQSFGLTALLARAGVFAAGGVTYLVVAKIRGHWMIEKLGKTVRRGG